MKLTTVIAFTFFYTFCFAQEACDCPANLDSAIKKVTRNYAGFNDKVNAVTQQHYNRLIYSLKKRAAQNNVDTNCLRVLKKYTAFFNDGHLGVSLLKRKPKDTSSFASLASQQDTDIPSISFQEKNCAILKIPSFSIEYNDTLHKILSKYTSELENSKNWIIDIRGNDGGAKDLYESLLPYIYTNPIIMPGAKSWCSTDNVKAAREEFEDYKNQVDSLTRVGWLKSIQKTEEHIGRWKNSYGPDTTSFNTIKTNPLKVIILINGGCASSAEIFLMKARQSKKVLLLGTPTNGTVDYGDVLYWDDMPYKPFNLRIATSRWDWIDTTGPIDTAGIKPNVSLANVSTSWLEYAKNFFK